MHRNNEGAIGAQAGRETRRRHANKKWAHSMHWACTQVHTPSSALGIPCNRRAAMLASWPRAAAASVAASRAALGFAARAREVAEQVHFLFSSPALVRRHPCRRVLPSRQAGPAALGQDVRLVRKTGHLKIKCRQAGSGGAGGGKNCYECVKVGHIASRSMAVTGTQSRRPGQGQGGLLERRRCCR